MSLTSVSNQVEFYLHYFWLCGAFTLKSSNQLPFEFDVSNLMHGGASLVAALFLVGDVLYFQYLLLFCEVLDLIFFPPVSLVD